MTLEDPARILRAVRFAGRTGFRIEPGTLEGLQDNLHLLQELPKSRLMMEVNALLSHGAAARSFLLLYRLKALDLLFPGHARYLRQRRVARAATIAATATRSVGSRCSSRASMTCRAASESEISLTVQWRGNCMATNAAQASATASA